MAARISQTALEALVQPSTAKTRVSQVVLEALAQPSTAKIRVSQIALEVLILPPSGVAIDERLRHGKGLVAGTLYSYGSET